jgi:hypothetical protein
MSIVGRTILSFMGGLPQLRAESELSHALPNHVPHTREATKKSHTLGTKNLMNALCRTRGGLYSLPN